MQLQLKANNPGNRRLLEAACFILALALAAGCGGTTTARVGASSYLFSQSATGGSLSAASGPGPRTLTLTGASPSTVRFSDRPSRRAGTIGTGAFSGAWPGIFKGSSPNALLVLATLNDKDVDSVVMVLSSPKYDAASQTMTYSVKELPASQDPATDWVGDKLTSLPSKFGPATLFIDAGVVDSASVKEYYGLCFSDWVKTKASYDSPPNAFIDGFLQTIAPSTQWITTYRDDWPDLNYAIKRAHAYGLKVAACAGVTWTVAGPDASNQGQVQTLIDLVNQGYVDLAIVGNEPEGNRGSPNNPYPLDRMAADLVGYINQVKSGTARKVKVGTRLVGVIAPDAPFQTIARACDVVQVNIHPGEFAAAGNNITIAQAVQRLANDFGAAKARLQGWGLANTELQIGETGWPSNDNPARPHYIPGLFTVANATAFRDQAMAWANANGVKVFYFEAADEPAKANYDMQNYSANWGAWHWYPDNPSVPFVGHFSKKY